MSSLFALTTEYRDAAMKLAELDMDAQTIADTLEGLSGDLEIKAQNVAMMARSLDADASAVKQWSKDAAERSKALEARAEALRDYLTRCMEACGIEKISGPGVSIGFRKSSTVVIDGVDLIPDEFMRVKAPPPPEPDKTAISAAIKAGREVPGAHIEHRTTLQIK